MVTIYLIVGGKIRTAQARIVGNIAEVETEYGVREFWVYHMSIEDAKKAVQKKKSRREGLRDEVERNINRMKTTPARGSPGRAGRRTK